MTHLLVFFRPFPIAPVLGQPTAYISPLVRAVHSTKMPFNRDQSTAIRRTGREPPRVARASSAANLQVNALLGNFQGARSHASSPGAHGAAPRRAATRRGAVLRRGARRPCHCFFCAGAQRCLWMDRPRSRILARYLRLSPSWVP